MMWNWTRLVVEVRPPGTSVSTKSIQLLGRNTIAALDPCPARNCSYSAVSGVAGVLAYGGMAIAPQYGTQGGLVIHGGGHGDYWGNEVYAFDVATATWSRINEPSRAAAPDTSASVDLEHGEYSEHCSLPS